MISIGRSGALRVEVERYPPSAAREALARLRAGQLKGRAELVSD
ncbi:hypothetical protein [Nonomuraea turcica]|nr:hypothetical protein [Nonomuraea sp. G32]MDP4512032.1 hypothetical protein [Nonomuraea sp. G32]